MKYAIAAALIVGATSLSAAPYYVGENLTPKNNITLGFLDAPTKKVGATGTGNLMAIELRGAYNVAEGLALRSNIPFYFVNKKASQGLASGTSSRNALGNISLGGNWNGSMTSESQVWTYGYAVGLDLYAPTSVKNEGAALIIANPTTDTFKYDKKGTSVVPTVGGFLSRDMFSLKANIGGGYTFKPKSVVGAGGDQHRNTLVFQTAGSWHAMPNLHLNAEYNTVVFDSAGKAAVVSTASPARFRHAITPSISANYESIMGNAYATVPVDKATCKATNVAFGLNCGYTF